jgi:hypothetical protein
VALVLVFQSSAGVVKRKRPLLIDGSTTLTDLVKIAAGRDGRELWPSAFAEQAMKMGSRYFLFSCWDAGAWLPVPHFTKLAHLASDGAVQIMVATAMSIHRVSCQKPDSSIHAGRVIGKPPTIPMHVRGLADEKLDSSILLGGELMKLLPAPANGHSIQEDTPDSSIHMSSEIMKPLTTRTHVRRVTGPKLDSILTGSKISKIVMPSTAPVRVRKLVTM